MKAKKNKVTIKKASRYLIRQTFKNISLQKVRVELQRLVTVLDHMLVQLQLTVAEGPVAETQ